MRIEGNVVASRGTYLLYNGNMGMIGLLIGTRNNIKGSGAVLSRIPGGCLLLCITQQLVSTIGNGIGID